MEPVFDLSTVRYMKRIVIGNADPEHLLTEEQIEEQRALLNRCLSEFRGRIIGMESNFYLLNIGQHQVVVQYLSYHIGFRRKPLGLDE